MDLALTETEFLAMNHRRFTLLHRRRLRLQWQEEYRMGCVTSAVYATGFARPKHPPKPDDFCFAPKPGIPARSSKPQTRQEIADVFRSLGPRRSGEGKW